MTIHWKRENEPLTSRLADVYLGMGIAVTQVQRLLLGRPDLELRFGAYGRLEVGYRNDWYPFIQSGTNYCEPDDITWEMLAALIAQAPKQPQAGARV